MKKISWAYQVTSLSEIELEKTADSLENIGADFTNFGLIPFSDEISYDEAQNPDNPVVVLGSTKLVKLWMKGKLPRNWILFYDSYSFSQINQLNRFLIKKEENGNPKFPIESYMLNFDACAYQFDAWLYENRTFSQDMFIRPDYDLKLFNGQILPANTSLKELFSQQTVDSDVYISKDFFIAAPVKNIIREYRCFVVDNKVIDFCIYKENGTLVKNKIDLGKKFNNLRIKSLALKFKPADVYVVDIAEIENKQYKIIEYNCFNCSGYYFCDREKIFKAVKAYMLDKY